MRTRWRRGLGLAAASCLLAGTAVAEFTTRAEAEGRTPSCSAAVPDTAAGYSDAFADMADRWIGGDQVSSVQLPDGRRLWLFGDTLFADRSPTGMTNVHMANSSFVLQDGGCFRPVAGPYRGSVLPSPGSGSRYWPQQAVVDGDRVWVSSLRVIGGSGVLDFQLAGVDLAEFRLTSDGVEFLELHRTPASEAGDYGVLWGTGLTVVDGTVKIYGTRRTEEALVGRELLLAKAPVSELANPSAWLYRTADGWSGDPAAAVVLHPARGGVATSLSAHRTEHGWLLVTQRDELGDRVVALRSESPWGPFRQEVLFESVSTETTLTYLPMAHPGLELRDGSLLVSISNNTTDLDRALSDPAALRPTFNAVQLTE